MRSTCTRPAGTSLGMSYWWDMAAPPSSMPESLTLTVTTGIEERSAFAGAAVPRGELPTVLVPVLALLVELLFDEPPQLAANHPVAATTSSTGAMRTVDRRARVEPLSFIADPPGRS